jgi:hypothetical protein
MGRVGLDGCGLGTLTQPGDLPMRRIAALLLLSLSPAFAFAQAVALTAPSPPAPALDRARMDGLVRLGGQVILEGKTYEYDRVLADEIGPRLTGSANYGKAVDWAVAEFQHIGLSQVHREGWELAAAWEPETWATGRILAPHEQRLHLESDGWSPSTPSGGVQGKVYYLNALTEEAVRTQAAQIKDAIILIDRNSLHSSNPNQFDKTLDAIALLPGEGARALMLGSGAVNDVPDMFGFTCCSGRLASLPVGNVGLEDSLLLRRLLERGPVEVEFSFTNRIREHVNVDNVVAEIPGTDANGEYVIIGGHLDSWHLGTGAADNGTGAASVVAVAQAIMASGLKPKRTMRFILFGGEEEGLLGSIRYVRAHANELDRCAGVFITDTGADAPKGWDVFGRDDAAKALQEIEPVLAPLDATGISNAGGLTFATDHGPFVIHGVPSFVLWTGGETYHGLHHKPSDTFDKVDRRDLNLGVAVVAITAFDWANAPAMLPHLNTADMEEQLKKIKAFDEYDDMKSHHEF